MSWGFFLYVNWFNPGQVYAFYAILEQWPLALLIQESPRSWPRPPVMRAFSCS